jgi:large conductance mechanosensitive channel
MPPLGVVLGGVNFSDLKIVMKEAVAENPAVTFNYGNFLQATVDFLIIAFAIFMFIKMMNRFHKKEAPTPKPTTPSNEEKLLTEIRDLLKNKSLPR